MQPLQLFQPKLAPFLKAPVLISWLVSCVLALIVLVSFFTVQPVIPLFYSLPQTGDYLVPKLWLIVFPFMSFFISIIHVAILKSLRVYEQVIQQLYAWVTVLMQALLLLALIRILWIIS